MEGPEILRLLAPTIGALALTLSCAAGPTGPVETPASATLPPQTLSPPVPEDAPPPPPPAAAPTPTPTVVVVDPGGEESQQDNLVAAALAEKERRRTLGPPVAVLHDKNIQTFAKDQKLTFANPEATVPAASAAAPGPSPIPKDVESYWRQRGRDLRERWRSLSDELTQVRERAAHLRVQFYSTDDPYIRDAEVKPAWDRALDRIDEIDREIARVKENLDTYLDEGQRADALPAWLLEGIELEPEVEPDRDQAAEPGEPVVYEEKPH